MKKGKARSIIMLSKTDNTVTSLNNLTDDITILSNDNANIQVTTKGQAIKIDSTQVSANKTDIATNFNKYLAGIQKDGTCNKNNDCNNALVNGRWYSEGKPNDPNAPTSANGILETYRPTLSSLYQRYTPYSADSYLAENLFHQRRGSNVDTEIVWSEWTMFSTEQTDTNTAAIATNKTDIATNKTDIATNFNKYLEGYDADGNFDKSIDCNKSINNGTWYCPTSTLNIPAECVDINASGYLEVTRATTLSLRQIFTPYGDSHSKKNLFWIRTAHDSTKKFADDTFEPWVKFGSFDQYLAGLGTNGRTSKNNDCNNAVVNGRWYSEGTPNDPNAPTVSNGILETYRATTGSVYQKYTPYASSSTAINLFYQRSGTDVSTKVVWSEWIKFSTEQTTTNIAAIATNKTDIATNKAAIATNKADITTNFNKYLAGIQNDGTCNKNNDCNNTVVNGRWYSNGTKNDPNAPTGSNGILETYRGTTESVYQKYTPYTSANTSINLFYQRSGTDVSTKVVWSEWIKFSTEQTTTNIAAIATNKTDIATNKAAIATNKTDIATNFNKYLAGIQKDGTCSKNNDCNNTVVNGRWYSEGKPNDPNAPTTANGILETYRPTLSSLYQRYTPYSADSYIAKNLFHQRRGSNVDTEIVWSEWTMFSTTEYNLPSRVVCFQRTEDPKQCGDKAVYSMVNASGHGTYTPSSGTTHIKVIVVGAGGYNKSGGSGGGTVVSYCKVPSSTATIIAGKKPSSKVAGGTSSIKFDKVTATATGGTLVDNTGGFGTLSGCFGTIHRGSGSSNTSWAGGSGLCMAPGPTKTNDQSFFPGAGVPGISKPQYEASGNGTVWIFEYGNELTLEENVVVVSNTKELTDSGKSYANILDASGDEFIIGEIINYDPTAYFAQGVFIECPDYVKIDSLYIDGKFTTPAPENREFYTYDWDKQIWILNESKKDNLISVISDKVKDQTNINMEASKWIRATEEREFEDAEIHMQFVNIENALDFTDTLASKTMEELIELLITDKFNI